jgi:putative membrane protein
MFFGGPGSGFGLGRLLIVILFLLFIGAVAYVVIRHFDRQQTQFHSHANTSSSAPSADSAASDVLKMRFAKGEINEDEFSRRMTLLKDHQTTS